MPVFQVSGNCFADDIGDRTVAPLGDAREAMPLFFSEADG